MPKPNPVPHSDGPAADAAQKARGESGAAVETVVPRRRRQFTAAEKLRILRAADSAIASGQRGALEALLRKEGIYSSHLSTWRQQLSARGSDGLAPRKPGRKPKRSATERELVELKRRYARLEHQLKVASAVIDLQKKAHAVLGITLPTLDEEEI